MPVSQDSSYQTSVLNRYSGTDTGSTQIQAELKITLDIRLLVTALPINDYNKSREKCSYRNHAKKNGRLTKQWKPEGGAIALKVILKYQLGFGILYPVYSFKNIFHERFDKNKDKVS